MARKAVAARDRTGHNFGSTTTRGCRRIAMATTAEQSIAQRQAEGEQQYGELLAYVTGAESRTATAYEVEERIFRSVLALGRTMLRLFFESRAAARPTGPV